MSTRAQPAEAAESPGRRASVAFGLAALLALLGACGGGSAPAATTPEQVAGIRAPLPDPKPAPDDEVAPPAGAVPRYLAVVSDVRDYDAGRTLVATTPHLVVADGTQARSAALVVAGAAAQFTTVRDLRSQPGSSTPLGLAAAFYAQAGRVWRLDLTAASTLAPAAVSTLATACAVTSAVPLDPNGSRALLAVQLADADGACAFDAPAILLPSDTPGTSAPPTLDPALRLLAPLATSAGVATALLVAEAVGDASEQLAVYDTALRRIGAVAGALPVARGTDRWLTPLRHTTHAALVQQGAAVHRIDWLGTTASLGASLYAGATADMRAVADAQAAWLDGAALLRYDPGRAAIAAFGSAGGTLVAQSADELFVARTAMLGESQTTVSAVAKADAAATQVLSWSTTCCGAFTGSFSEYLQRAGALVEILGDQASDAWGGYLYVEDGTAARPDWAQVDNAGAVFAARQGAFDTRVLQGTLACADGLLDAVAVRCRPGEVVETDADGTRLLLGTMAADYTRFVPPVDLRLGVPTLARADDASIGEPAGAGGWRHVVPVVVLVPGVAGSLASVAWAAPATP